MLKLYHENPEFNEYTAFDTDTGRMDVLTKDQFSSLLPQPLSSDSSEYVQHIKGSGREVFFGATPASHTRFPRRIYFQITRHCNLECPACFIKASRLGAHVPVTAVMRIIELSARYGLAEVRLTGGEPTLHPHFIDIVHHAQASGVYVSVATNGIISRPTLEALAEAHGYWLIFSLDGTRATHNSYRGRTYDQIMDNMRYLRRRNPELRIRINTVLTKKNMSEMWHLGQVCRDIGAESITIIPLRPQVRDPAIKAFMVTSKEFRSVIETLVDVRTRFGVSFTTTIETDYKKYMASDPVFTKRSSCAAGREGTNLDYDVSSKRFQVYGCSYSPAADLDASPKVRQPFLAGEFGIDDPEQLLSIWRDDARWVLFRELSLKSTRCKECEFLKNKTCTGSCPIQNIDYDSLDVESNVLDQLKQQITGTAEWYCYKNIADA